MQTKQTHAASQELGEAIAQAYDISRTVAADRSTANELAARHLERVLVRSANLRLVTALRDLASDLARPRARASRPTARSLAWAPERLALAR